ncbi:MAG: helix-turn-helix transcriptional regulator [Clostridia bacterium]|nr:helix-turn-helix transcriptional regulator [Clostridia bacterium]
MELLRNLTVTGNLEVVTVRQIKGTGAEIKSRPSYGLSFCYDGQITYTLDGVDYISDPDCAIILPKGKTYSLRIDKGGFFPLINFDCDGFLCDKHIVLPLKNPSALIKEFEYIKKLSLFEKNRPKMMSAFYSLLDGIISQTDESGSIIGGAVAYLEANLSDPTLTNAVLANQANISEVYFRQLFLKRYGITPRQYIIGARIAKAKQMLSSGNKKISAIAEECGFVSVYHFSRCFKEKTGMTPTEYMNSNRILGL